MTNLRYPLGQLHRIRTGDVECLTSYICRLADAHCVSPTNLFRYQIEPAADNGRIKAAKSVNLQSYPSGDNRVAVRYVQALEYLTSHHAAKFVRINSIELVDGQTTDREYFDFAICRSTD